MEFSIFFFDFLEIEKTFKNKKGVIFEFMFKSQFLLNSVGYFLKKMKFDEIVIRYKSRISSTCMQKANAVGGFLDVKSPLFR